MEQPNLESLIDQVADLILDARRIVVFSGAGISTESGIPDFRSPGGIWEKYNPEDFTYQKFISDTKGRRKRWQMFKDGYLVGGAEPNPAHHATAELDRLGKLDCVITQNIDCLHQRAGVPDDKVFELHGSMRWVVCLSCGQRYPWAQIKARLDQGEEVPDCEACHGLLKPAVVFFGEELPREVLLEATSRAYKCDLFIVIGSTLVVYPAAYMPEYAVRQGAKLVIINLSPTPLDGQAAVVVRAKAGETMPRIIERVKKRIA